MNNLVEVLSSLNPSTPAERCYELHKRASKRYYDEHKENVKMRMSDYYLSHKEEVRVYKAMYYQNKKQNSMGKKVIQEDVLNLS